MANNSATSEAREKSTYLESLEFLKFFDVCLTNFENYQILLSEISQIFRVTTKLFNVSLIEISALSALHCLSLKFELPIYSPS
jgi:hypothetical protein